MFNPEKLIDIGKKIINQTKWEKESRVRVSIASTYHGAFLASKKKLEDKFKTVFNDNNLIHKEVIEKLKESQSSLGDKLETLNEYRESTTLSLDSEHDITDATHCSGIADSLMTQIKKL